MNICFMFPLKSDKTEVIWEAFLRANPHSFARLVFDIEVLAMAKIGKLAVCSLAVSFW